MKQVGCSSAAGARRIVWWWMLLLLVITVISFERKTVTATSSTFCFSSSSSYYGSSSSLSFLRQQRQQQRQQPCSNRMPSFVVTTRGGGGNDSTISSSQLESSSLSTDQSEFQHLIVEFSEEQVDALMEYSQKCADFDNGDKGEHPTYQFESLRKQLQDVYDEYGVVLVRGLLKKEMLSKLVEGGNYLVEKEKMKFEADSFRSIKFGPVFGGASVELEEEDSSSADDQLLATFRQVALKSAVPACIALLMNLDTNKNVSDDNGSKHELRLLNDVFLAKGSADKSFCGWHIDDAVFWPCQPTTAESAKSDSSSRPAGINAWIAMDDILSEFGGSMAVIPKSHTSEWASEAQHVIGHTTTHPPEGFTALPQLFQTITKTCAIADNAPLLNSKMESEGILFDFQKGDVLLMNRYLWHRSVMLSQEGKQYYLEKQKSMSEDNEVTLKRYTIRYEVGNAPLIKGISIHPSILFDSKNSGQTLSDVVHRSGPFFPKCWPTVNKDEMFQIKELVDEKLPKAEQVKFEMFMKMKQQQQPQTEAMSSSSSDTT